MSSTERPVLFEKLRSHYNQSPVSFHVPGHKLGVGFPPHGKSIFNNILSIDMTEITGLDDLHQPEGVIKQAQLKAAKLFSADQTFFLVNGSTAGNLAMVLSVCQPGDKIIVQRNVHKSIINAMMLARAVPIYITPEEISTLGITGAVTVEQVKDALIKSPDAKAVFIMNPNYYGICIDITDIAEVAHKYDIPLLVDEAHGAHFGLHPSLPPSALQMGADMVVQSTHKTLSALTMGSMLHIKGKLIDIDRVKLFLSMIQSSSPSYPIMASLELSVQWIAEQGEKLWYTALNAVNILKKRDSFQTLELFPSIDPKYLVDPLKLIIHSKSSAISGFELQQRLQQKNIYTELADLQNVLAIITFGNTINDLDKLYIAIKEIDQDIINHSYDLNGFEANQPIYPISDNILNIQSKSEVSLEKVLYGKKESVLFEDSVGKVSAEMVIPYPPGIPMIQLGERITKEVIQYLLLIKEKGAKFQGIQDQSLKFIQVLDI